jgi:hypothetical protein
MFYTTREGARVNGVRGGDRQQEPGPCRQDTARKFICTSKWKTRRLAPVATPNALSATHRRVFQTDLPSTSGRSKPSSYIDFITQRVSNLSGARQWELVSASPEQGYAIRTCRFHHRVHHRDLRRECAAGSKPHPHLPKAGVLLVMPESRFAHSTKPDAAICAAHHRAAPTDRRRQNSQSA